MCLILNDCHYMLILLFVMGRLLGLLYLLALLLYCHNLILLWFMHLLPLSDSSLWSVSPNIVQHCRMVYFTRRVLQYCEAALWPLVYNIICIADHLIEVLLFNKAFSSIIYIQRTWPSIYKTVSVFYV